MRDERREAIIKVVSVGISVGLQGVTVPVVNVGGEAVVRIEGGTLRRHCGQSRAAAETIPYRIIDIVQRTVIAVQIIVDRLTR